MNMNYFHIDNQMVLRTPAPGVIKFTILVDFS